MSTDDLKLHVVYREHFNKYCDWLKEKIDLGRNGWLKDLKDFIEEKDWHYISIALTNSDQITRIVDYLIRKNSICQYKAFIKIWKEHDQAIAKQFEANLKYEIDNVGLTDADNASDNDVGCCRRLSLLPKQQCSFLCHF